MVTLKLMWCRLFNLGLGLGLGLLLLRNVLQLFICKECTVHLSIVMMKTCKNYKVLLVTFTKENVNVK